MLVLFIWRHDAPSWRGDVIKWRHLQKNLKFGIIHQISGHIHATEKIFASFCTFPRTINSKIIELWLHVLQLTFEFKVERNFA